MLLVVESMAHALAFYENVLGCTLEETYPQWGMAQLRAGSALINLVDVSVPEGAWAASPVAGGRNMDHLCIALGRHDEAALRRHLARAPDRDRRGIVPCRRAGREPLDLYPRSLGKHA